MNCDFFFGLGFRLLVFGLVSGHTTVIMRRVSETTTFGCCVGLI